VRETSTSIGVYPGQVQWIAPAIMGEHDRCPAESRPSTADWARWTYDLLAKSRPPPKTQKDQKKAVRVRAVQVQGGTRGLAEVTVTGGGQGGGVRVRLSSVELSCWARCAQMATCFALAGEAR
jgi:hypothetical protein